MVSFVFCILSTCGNLSQENSVVFCGYSASDFSEEEFRQRLPSKVLVLPASSAPIFTGPI